MPWISDDELDDDEPVVQIEWAKANQNRFDRNPRVQKYRRIDGAMYELCALGGVHWIRRSARGEADEVAVFDGPMGSEKDTEELWQKIISREAV